MRKGRLKQRKKRLPGDPTRVDGAAPQWTPVDSEALLGRTLGNLHFALEDMQAEVTYDPLPRVQGDAKQLGLVLQNLVGNALKFHGEASPRIHIAARRDGRHWVFAVRDNGIDIDPKHTERIFGVFQRLHTRREYPGTGSTNSHHLESFALNMRATQIRGQTSPAPGCTPLWHRSLLR